MGKEEGAFLDSLLVQRQELNLLKPALVKKTKQNTHSYRSGNNSKSLILIWTKVLKKLRSTAFYPTIKDVISKYVLVFPCVS